MAVEPRDNRSVPELLSDLLRETTDLFKTEGELIRSEISDKITQVEIGGGSIAAGAICLLVALFVLAQALIVALGSFMGDAWAALLVGVVIAGIGVALLFKGRNDLSPANLTPDRTARQLRKDGQLVKEQTR
ncbi:phage holin family protein [Aurantimonas sp. C2-6-R+9]|uniref:Phage holin family protein n=2 Tax=root TaxID=1 RepID=A0A0F9UVM5_9ZZZZ|nr:MULTISPECIES: phage holin family protein [unclassified Aurantimonas]MEC5290741.1 phage holin family protein [Aurantimonas sp. C2-3-R2]MEC5324567.1 phage holin family protein [Aurantimonas sp. A3-2-R12]MEC5380757.1 phage holin family protein [Aurantimonas sp. C2-6-R+9]MEC5411806.1 phage holin family protein [Aurantimonas sp. C2-4-R8]HDZ72420.1 phage holin family protein [Aurantimonas coralicida]